MKANTATRHSLKKALEARFKRNYFATRSEALGLIEEAAQESGLSIGLISGDTIPGDSGSTVLRLHQETENGGNDYVENFGIVFSWYRMDSGNWEIVVYLS